eukprot:TRINITY_DN3254_c0_g1_i2.p2 TRINITY_DN3254_c0_g1~~TRINITY_DN3254_c0_g1_i2.p2  ORF type:complete len:316 (+),score=57.28 TRINITY_DN3254_c0_g1_i2:337-1284(+)
MLVGSSRYWSRCESRWDIMTVSTHHRQLVQRGSNVTIIARNQTRLDEALEELEHTRINEAQIITTASADVTSLEDTEAAMNHAAKTMHGIDILITSAGLTRPGKFMDVPIDLYQRIMDVNYMGTINSIHASMTYLRKAGSNNPDGARLVMVGSMAGLVGLTGFAAYSPTKFAIRGLADCLYMELRPENIRVSVVHPPDVDTPMLKDEMQYKPLETKLISEGTGLISSEEMTRDIISGIERGDYHIVNCSMESKLVALLGCGFGPSTSMIQSLLEIVCLPVCRIAALGYLYWWSRICTKCHKEGGGDHAAVANRTY